MPPSGTSTCFDPDDYQSNVRGARIDLVLASRTDFKARLTWVEFNDLHLFRSLEKLPRIAHVSLLPERVYVVFPMSPDPPPIWGGVTMKLGDIFLHSGGERIHQRTNAASRWGSVSLTPKRLAIHGKTL